MMLLRGGDLVRTWEVLKLIHGVLSFVTQNGFHEGGVKCRTKVQPELVERLHGLTERFDRMNSLSRSEVSHTTATYATSREQTKENRQ